MDFDGRMLAEASPGPGERIVVAPIDITAVRHERAARRGHHMLAHLRTEAYPVYSVHQYPPASSRQLSYERNVELIDVAKALLSQPETRRAPPCHRCTQTYLLYISDIYYVARSITSNVLRGM